MKTVGGVTVLVFCTLFGDAFYLYKVREVISRIDASVVANVDGQMDGRKDGRTKRWTDGKPGPLSHHA